MPNRVMTASGLKNFTKGKKTKTSVTAKVPAEKAEKASELLTDEAVKVEKVLEKPEPEIVYSSLDGSDVVLELHYWVKNPEDVSEVRSRILSSFSERAKRKKIFGDKE